MMGIVIALCGIAGLIVSSVAAALGFALLRRAAIVTDTLFWTVAIAVGVLLVVAAIVLFSGPRSTAPTAADFLRLMKLVFAFGTAPGIAVLVAALFKLFR